MSQPVLDRDIERDLEHLQILKEEADRVRENDKVVIRSLFGDFYGRKLNVGIRFERAYGSILAGDYFELFKLPDGNYFFAFADISGHGLPAYTSLLRLRNAIIIAVKGYTKHFQRGEKLDAHKLVKNVCTLFTDLMETAGSSDFASVIFTVITSEGDKYHLDFFNRGMYFPLVVRRFEGSLLDVYDLNEQEKGWYPVKGYLLSSDMRQMLGERYDVYESCRFTLYEGDSLLFYTDGLLEARDFENQNEEYGMIRLKEKLVSFLNRRELMPQDVVNKIYDDIYRFMGDRTKQDDDMSAVLIDLPLVR